MSMNRYGIHVFVRLQTLVHDHHRGVSEAQILRRFKLFDHFREITTHHHQRCSASSIFRYMLRLRNQER